MSNMYGKDKFHDRQKAVLQKSAQKIENDSGWSQDNFLRGYAEEILPASGAELSFGELCAIGEQVEQEAAFSAKEAMRNKIKANEDRAYSFPVYRRGYDCPKESGICFQRNQAPSVTSDSSMIRYTSDSKHHKR